LLPNAGRPNLHVLTDALVTKLVASEDGAVTGVDFLHGSKSHTVQAKKEVILSAGVIKSPQILELSGIGDPKILSNAGIKCLVNNPRVGENFQDHPATAFGYELVEGEKSLDMLESPEDLQAAMAAYMSSKSGPLSSGGAAMGFVSYADLATHSEIADLQKLILSTEYGGHDEATKKLLAEGIADHGYGSIQTVLLPATLDLTSMDSQVGLFQPPKEQLGKHGFVLAACIARPLSVGSIHITSSDPTIDPAIDPAYLSHPADIEVFAKGMEMLTKMTSTSPFKEKIKRRYHPAGELDQSDRKAVEAYLRTMIATQYHPIGSVAMGKKGVGAVDERLRVWGAKGVRVVDASVMPLHISGNILASVYAIAEKGSDLIKEDWGL